MTFATQQEKEEHKKLEHKEHIHYGHSRHSKREILADHNVQFIVE
jgi:hypothetical protein